MFQRTYTFVNDDGLDRALADMHSRVTDPARALVCLFEDSWEEDRLRGIQQRIRAAVPGVRVAGITHHHQLFRRVDVQTIHTTLSLLCFDQSDFDVYLEDLSEIGERMAAGAIRAHMLASEAVKGALLLSTGVEVDVEYAMNRLNEALPSVPLFGATAGISRAPGQETASYVLYNGRVCRRAMLAVVFRGKNLQIQASEVFGWTPIGKRMRITRMKDRNTVLEVDGRPASEIYTHYLGLTRAQVNADNCCEFPVFRWSKRRIAARICLSAGEDGSVSYGAPLYNGDILQFSYGNPNDILTWTTNTAGRLAPFAPQALLLISCVNRIIFLGPEQEKENEAFRRMQPEMALIHGNSELMLDAQGGGELNSALVYAAMREGEAPGEVAEPQACDGAATATGSERVPFVRRLLTFLDVTTRELEALEQNLSDEVQRQTATIRRQRQALNDFNREIVLTLSNAIDAKDSYTNGHSRRVAEYAREIARRYGYSPVEQEDVYIIGLLHDVGKIGVPDEIINKPGKLTDAEFAMIKRHPAIGAEILSSLTQYPDIASGAHWHHERWDGRGYPDGLRGEAIPEIARIISVADAYDAMTSTRSYRPVMEQARVRGEIEKGRGTQFAPVFADIMLQMIDDDPDYKMKGNVARVENT